MKRTSMLLFVAILISACRSENGTFSNKDQIIGPFPVLLDTTNSGDFNLSKEMENSTWLTTAQYGIYYIGLKRDTVFLNPFFCSPPPPIPEDATMLVVAESEPGVNSRLPFNLDCSNA